MDRAQVRRDNKLLVGLIEEAADQHGVAPQEVTVRQFKQFAVKELAGDDRLELAQRVSKMSAARFNSFRDAQVSQEIGPAQIEHEDLRARARDSRADLRGKLRDQVFVEHLSEALTKVFSGVKIAFPREFQAKKPAKDANDVFEREVTLLLSDLHYGARLSAREVPLDYGVHEEARRTAAVFLQAADYKRQYRKVTRLNLNIAGDIVQGKLHDQQDSARMAEQLASALWYLVQGVTYASTQFPEVVVRVVPGNHDRDLQRHMGRATTEKWDSHAQFLYFSLKMACQGLKNVRFEIPYTPYVAYRSFDRWVFGTHGDTVLNVGYPGNSINVKAIEQQVNKINSAAWNQHGHRYDLFWVGHVHFGTNIRLPNGVVVVTNPALIPPDGYAVSLGSLESSCGQSLWESVPGFAMGDYRLLQVDKNTDKDASLEKIIKPFEGF